ncbi:hypothetical protein CC86DRAFT_69261 [Ophiobolus disseminans]|uniref:Uncharacterized protein n=1 Tax=Ophiobolus disseminans TaxID=1469910 RepID=A0A6A6ZR54_9PLEO|nr:hypothetical protein CC86DRAFT_69261 [Ophiobolus disseminans]
MLSRDGCIALKLPPGQRHRVSCESLLVRPSDARKKMRGSAGIPSSGAHPTYGSVVLTRTGLMSSASEVEGVGELLSASTSEVRMWSLQHFGNKIKTKSRTPITASKTEERSTFAQALLPYRHCLRYPRKRSQS